MPSASVTSPASPIEARPFPDVDPMAAVYRLARSSPLVSHCRWCYCPASGSEWAPNVQLASCHPDPIGRTLGTDGACVCHVGHTQP